MMANDEILRFNLFTFVVVVIFQVVLVVSIVFRFRYWCVVVIVRACVCVCVYLSLVSLTNKAKLHSNCNEVERITKQNTTY